MPRPPGTATAHPVVDDHPRGQEARQRVRGRAARRSRDNRGTPPRAGRVRRRDRRPRSRAPASSPPGSGRRAAARPRPRPAPGAGAAEAAARARPVGEPVDGQPDPDRDHDGQRRDELLAVPQHREDRATARSRPAARRARPRRARPPRDPATAAPPSPRTGRVRAYARSATATTSSQAIDGDQAAVAARHGLGVPGAAEQQQAPQRPERCVRAGGEGGHACRVGRGVRRAQQARHQPRQRHHQQDRRRQEHRPYAPSVPGDDQRHQPGDGPCREAADRGGQQREDQPPVVAPRRRRDHERQRGVPEEESPVAEQQTLGDERVPGVHDPGGEPGQQTLRGHEKWTPTYRPARRSRAGSPSARGRRARTCASAVTNASLGTCRGSMPVSPNVARREDPVRHEHHVVGQHEPRGQPGPDRQRAEHEPGAGRDHRVPSSHQATNATSRVAWQAEQALADDVEVDLGGAAADGHRARGQQRDGSSWRRSPACASAGQRALARRAVRSRTPSRAGRAPYRRAWPTFAVAPRPRRTAASAWPVRRAARTRARPRPARPGPRE